MTINPHTPLDPLSEQVLADDYERRDRSHEAELDRDRHVPAPDFHQHLDDGCRWFPEPVSGWRLTWVGGEEPRLEREDG